MDFSPHLRTVFRLRGSPATYAPPSGGEVSCRAIRQGGGQPVRIGPVVITPERISFHVLREDIASPAAGATLSYGGEIFTVDASQPVESDVEGLLWSLEASWGTDVLYRAVAGSGSTQNPPQTGALTVAADANAGSSAIGIKSNLAVGKLIAGDKLTIGGTEYTVTADVTAVMSQFSGVPVSPVLSADAVSGSEVVPTYKRDIALRAAVASYAAKEFMGGVQAGDRRLVVMQAALAALDGEPKAGDRIVFGGRTFNVQSAAPIYEGTTPIAWDIQARG